MTRSRPGWMDHRGHGRRTRRLASAALLLAAGCGPRGGEDAAASGEVEHACAITQAEVSLAGEVYEASGAAIDPERPGVFWTHGDSGQEPVVFALSATGRLLGRPRVTGATNRDWEDMAAGPCPGGHCLYLGDIGNNEAAAVDLVLYRVPLPDPAAAQTAQAETFRARFPGGGRDAEALFVLPSGEIYLVNKGREGPVELWRWPTPLQPGPVELQPVKQVAPRIEQVGDFVTGAGASQDGRWVALRTYGRLALYRTAELLGGGGPAFTMDLAPLGEAWGEAVAVQSDGTVLLVSEGRSRTTGSRAAWLQCTLPEE